MLLKIKYKLRGKITEGHVKELESIIADGEKLFGDLEKYKRLNPTGIDGALASMADLKEGLKRFKELYDLKDGMYVPKQAKKARHGAKSRDDSYFSMRSRPPM